MSLSNELVRALDALAETLDESRSSAAETLLREAPQIRNSLRALRGDDGRPRDLPVAEQVGSHVRRVYR